MDPITVKLEMPELINKSLSPVAESIGNTLDSIWGITFGWIDISKEKVQAKRLKNLNEFKESLYEGISSIPEEKLAEPNLAILGPAIEASKYYFEEEALRDMFAKLITNSMNLEYKNYLSNAFVEIIKQLSPLDAQILSAIFKNGSAEIIKCKRPHPDSSAYDLVHPLVFLLEGQDEKMIDSNSVSLINLERLGLISIKFDEHFADATRYQRLESLSCTSYPIVIQENGQTIVNVNKYDIGKGILYITPFGSNFCTCCL